MTSFSRQEDEVAFNVPSTTAVHVLGKIVLPEQPVMNEDHPHYEDWKAQVAPASLFD